MCLALALMAWGGMTNAVLHLLGMACAFGVDLAIDDFQKVCAVTTFSCELCTFRRYAAVVAV